MPVAYSYVRFSTPEQAKGDSFRRQTEDARTYAAEHGLELDERLTFHDLGISAFRGANVETGQLGAFRQAIDAGLVQSGSYLLVESLDRLSRQHARRALRVLEDIVDRGIVVVTLSDRRAYTREALDSDPMSLLMALLIFIRSNEESERKSDRLRKAWTNKRNKIAEKPLTARAPAWLRLQSDDRWQVLEDRAAVVRRMFDMAVAGIGEHTIAATLNRESVPVFGRGRFWHRTYVAKVLRSRAVLGYCTPFTVTHATGRKVRTPQNEIAGYFPAILEPDTVQTVIAMREVGNPKRGRHAFGELKNLFGGLARCPNCGATMTRVTKGNVRKAGSPKLVCTAAKVGKDCPYVGVDLDELEESFALHVWTLLGYEPPSAKQESVAAELEKARATARLYEARFAAAADSNEASFNDSAWFRVLVDLREKLDVAQQRVEDLEKESAKTSDPVLQHRLERLRQAFKDPENVDRAAANAVLRQLYDRIVIDHHKGRMVLHWKVSGQSEIEFQIPDHAAALAARARRMRRSKTGQFQVAS